MPNCRDAVVASPNPIVRVVGRDTPAVAAGPHPAAASKNTRVIARSRTLRTDIESLFGLTPDPCPYVSYSPTMNGHAGGLATFPFLTTFLTTLIFIIVSYDALAASYASEMSADSKLRV